MKSLFEKEERENMINEIKVDLISRFHPLSKHDVIKYKSILNFDQSSLMTNQSIQWDNEMIDNLNDKLDWTAIWKLKNIKIDISFFKKHEQKIDFHSIQHSKCIIWTDELLTEYGEKFDWSKWLITKETLASAENLRKYKDKIDWSYISRTISVVKDENILNEFMEYWDWQKLSYNPNLPLSVAFIKKHIDKLDFNNLSRNPASLDLIYKYPNSQRWNWNRVINDPGIKYNKENFELIYYYYKRQHNIKEINNPLHKRLALRRFLNLVFSNVQCDKYYFLNEEFVSVLPWEIICNRGSIKLPFEFIEKHKDQLNFKESEFIRMHYDVLSTAFIEENIDLFNTEHYTFYYLPITTSILNKYSAKVNWNHLSSCEKLNWNWEYFEMNFEKFNIYRLKENKGIYETLIKDRFTNAEIFEFLDKELKLNRK